MRPLLQPLYQPLPIDAMPTHAPILETRHAHWPDEAACAACAAALAARPGLGQALIELRGPLGAGKTSFVRHLLRARGVGGRIRSPSFAIVEPHALEDGTPVHHFDFYRFEQPREWVDAGFRDRFAGPGLKLVEWPEKAAGLLPRADLVITIAPGEGDDERQVTLQAQTALGLGLLP